MSIRLMQTPNNYPFTHGWGVYPQLESHVTARRRAAKCILRYIDGSKTGDKSNWQFSLRLLEKTFLAIEAENSRDWFTLANHFGQPSRALAGEIRTLLTTMKTLVPAQHGPAVTRFLAQLDTLAFPDMLQTYLDTTSAESAADTDMRAGWCNIVWSDLHPTTFLVGVTEGRPNELVELLDARKPDSRHGLLSAWQIDDVDAAADALASTFGRDRDDLGLMRLGRTETLPQIKLITENAIWKLIVPSPWHVEPDCGPATDLDDDVESFELSMGSNP